MDTDGSQLIRALVAHGLSSDGVALLESWMSRTVATMAGPESEPDSPTTAVPPVEPTDRYELVALLGRGGMGEVWRARDRWLEREVALKMLRAGEPGEARLHDEARRAARLAHPVIVPIHDIGRLPDGRLFYAMRRVTGRTLEEVVRSGDGAWTLFRLVDTVLRVAEAMRLVHHAGVLHLDLTPSNVMVGEYGSVYLLDWGIAHVVGTAVRVRGGTRGYAAPEQLDGGPLTPATDVYALGGVLAFVLTGRPPHDDTLESWCEHATRRGVSQELVELVQSARALEPSDRPSHTDRFVYDLLGWQAGETRRSQADQLVAEADAIHPEIEGLVQAARTEDRAARERLEALAPDAPVEDKAPAWGREERAAQLRREARLRRAQYAETLHAALQRYPRHVDAHARLTSLYRASFKAAELERADDAVEHEVRLRTHADPETLAWLSADGRVSLLTEPAGATVTAYRYVSRLRRRVTVKERVLGLTPLREVRLPPGDYLLAIEAVGHRRVRYPVRITRGGHWDGVPPGAPERLPIVLPRPEQLGEDEVYVPAGWVFAGGNPRDANGLEHRAVWVDGFIAQRDPVTHRTYMKFLERLDAQGLSDTAQRAQPRERPTAEGPGAPLYGRDTDGAYLILQDVVTRDFELDFPVVMIDWFGAMSFATEHADRTQQPWQIPGEWAWEKMARGTDGRVFPWGDGFDPAFCNMDRSCRGRQATTCDAFPVDVSPYGVRGLGGNTADWCLDAFSPCGPQQQGGNVLVDPGELDPMALRPFRGGTWFYAKSVLQVTFRYGSPAVSRMETLGVRLIRPFGGSST